MTKKNLKHVCVKANKYTDPLIKTKCWPGQARQVPSALPLQMSILAIRLRFFRLPPLKKLAHWNFVPLALPQMLVYPIT